jgi:hypothetical protein
MMAGIGELVSRKRSLCCDVGRQSVEVDNAVWWLEDYVKLEGQNSSAALQFYVRQCHRQSTDVFTLRRSYELFVSGAHDDQLMDNGLRGKYWA